MNNKQAKRIRNHARGYGTEETTYETVQRTKRIGTHTEGELKGKPIMVVREQRVIEKACRRRPFKMLKRAYRKANRAQREEMLTKYLPSIPQRMAIRAAKAAAEA